MSKDFFVDRLSTFLGEKLCYLYLFAVAIIGVEVLARYFLGSPTIWAHEASVALCALGFIFGGTYAMRRGAHVRIDIVVRLLPAHWRRRIELVNHVIIVVYLCIFLYACWLISSKSWEQMETSGSAWNQPTPVLLKTALGVGAFALLLQTITHIIKLWRGIDLPGEDPMEAPVEKTDKAAG